jgi:hypothetical protein
VNTLLLTRSSPPYIAAVTLETQSERERPGRIVVIQSGRGASQNY